MTNATTSRPGNRLLLIKPSNYDADGRLIRGKRSFFPSRTLPYVSALAVEGWDMRLLDDACQEVTGREDVDLVVFTAMLCNVPRAIDLATQYRARGVTTIIGGIGAFSLGETIEQSGAFDAVVYGEAETVWPGVLDDYRAGRLQPVYDGGRARTLADQPLPRYDLVDLKRYIRIPGEPKPFFCMETSRGCPHACRFCGVTLFFGRQMRFRPVADVVEEMRATEAGYFIFTDDNVAANPERAKELFEAIRPLNVRWAGQFEMGAAKRPDVLRAAGESGCRHAVVGVESLVGENLCEMDKTHNTRVTLDECVAAFHDAGIAFTASLIFGLDHDTPEVIRWTYERTAASGAEFALPWVLTPGPGSELFDEFKAAGRLLHENYSLYNGVDIVFEPARMTVEQLREAYWSGLRWFYRVGRCLGRAWRSHNTLDTLGLNLYFWNTVRRGRHPFTGAV